VSTLRPAVVRGLRGSQSVNEGEFVVNFNVLIIDDDEGTLSTYRAILRLEGYEVTTAANGREGLEILKARAPEFDLVMADLRLPDMSGLEVLAEVRDEWPGLPIVLISAWATPAIERAAMQLGSAAVVHKPIWAEELPALVGRTVSKTRPLTPPMGGPTGMSRWLLKVQRRLSDATRCVSPPTT
jgi:DNA-binding NtrC family response regulator